MFRRRPIWTGLLIGLLTALTACWPVVGAGFIGDDDNPPTANPAVASPDKLPHLNPIPYRVGNAALHALHHGWFYEGRLLGPENLSFVYRRWDRTTLTVLSRVSVVAAVFSFGLLWTLWGRQALRSRLFRAKAQFFLSRPLAAWAGTTDGTELSHPASGFQPGSDRDGSEPQPRVSPR